MSVWIKIDFAPKDRPVDLWIVALTEAYRETDCFWGNGDLGPGWTKTSQHGVDYSLVNDGEITHYMEIPGAPNDR